MFRVGLHFLVFLGNVYRSALVPQTPVHVIGHYSAIFIHIENLVQHLHMKSWNVQNPSITASQRLSRTLSYLRKRTNI